MSKPTAGSQHVAIAGDTWESLAAQAYGDSKKWTLIIKANQSSVKSTEPVVGQVINIPIIAENELLKTETATIQLGNKKPDELTILIGGLQLLVEKARIFTQLDAGVDGFNCDIQWEPDKNPELDAITLPYSYTPASCYIGNQLIVKGFLYTTIPALGKRSTKTLECWGATADIVDSNLKPPYEQSNKTLGQLAEEAIKSFGLNVIFDVGEDEFFDRVKIGSTETVFGYLARLASQRGVLITSTPGGDVLFTKAGTGANVGSLEEGAPPVLNWEARFDGRKRFNVYKGNSQSPGDNARTAKAIDDNIPKSRFRTFAVNETTDGNVQQAADWKRSKAVADALSFQLPVSGWLAPNGLPWIKNSLVTVISPTLHIPNGFTMLIRKIDFTFGGSGQTAILHLTPPQAYTGEAIEEPWL